MNIKCMWVLVFVLLLSPAPAALAQPGRSPAAEAGSVEDIARPSAETQPAAPALNPPSTAPGALAPASAGPPSYGLDMLWALGAFILVMALLYLALKALGRLGRFRGGKGRRSVFELWGVQPLDNRKYLAAVAVEGRLIVVGVTPDRITPVAHWLIDEDRDGLDFNAAALGPDPGPSLEVELPEEDHSPLDISVADLNRDSRK